MAALTKSETERLSRKRVELAKATKKDSFAVFSLGQSKAVTKVNHDPLSKEDRARINAIKEKLAYPDEGYESEEWEE